MLINQYTATPPYRSLAREIAYLARYVFLFFRNGFKHRTILFYPDYPWRKSEITKIVMQSEYNITNNPNQRFDLVFYWKDTTIGKTDPFLQRVQQQYPVINVRCLNIAKDRVDEVFREVFGYSSLIDPLRHVGLGVKKSLINGRHDGQVITCPIPKREEGCVYQLLLENPLREGVVQDYRVPVFKNDIPFLLIRHKPLTDRFDGTLRAEMACPTAIFTPAEMANIHRFCEKIGLEYGELDVIRNQADGRVYIVDANNTPSSPPSFVPISKHDRKRMLEESVRAFRKNFLR